MAEEKSKPRATTFFILTFFLSWLIWIPLDLSHFQIGPISIPETLSSLIRLAGVLMPAVSALILSKIIGGKKEVRELLSRFGIWNVGWQWWAAAALLQPAVLVLSGLVHNMLRGEPLTPSAPQSAGMLAVNIFFLLLATLGEEIGWHGLALPALQKKFSPLKSSLILGVLWGLWHVPFWLLLDTFSRFGFGYLALNLLMILPMTIIVTWFFNHGKGSLLLPVAFHFVFNLVNVIWLPVTLSIRAFSIFIALEMILAALVMQHLIADENIRIAHSEG
jgi:membrane protease YdiL (CAAX protease family)